MFCEPASAASVAGLIQRAEAGDLAPRRDRRLRPHRPRPEGPRHRDRQRRAGAPPARRPRRRGGGGVRPVSTQLESLTVSAPATSANLGPGFDCLAVALDLGNAVVVAAPPRPPRGARSPARARASWPRTPRTCSAGRWPPAWGRSTAWHVECRNRIPLGRGLGSSAAAVCAGLVAANALGGLRWTPDDLLRPRRRDRGPRRQRGRLPQRRHGRRRRRARWRGRCRCPTTSASSPSSPRPHLHRARRARRCRTTVPLADAAATLANAVGLALALAEGRMEDLPDVLHDRLHEPYRGPLVPGIEAIRARGGRRRLPGRHDLRAPARRCCCGAGASSPTASWPRPRPPSTAPTCPGTVRALPRPRRPACAPAGPAAPTCASRARWGERRPPTGTTRGGVLDCCARAAGRHRQRQPRLVQRRGRPRGHRARRGPRPAPGRRGRRRGRGGRRVAALLGAHARRGRDRAGRAGDRAPGRRAGRAGGGRHLQAGGRRGPAIAAGAAILNDPTGLREPEMAAGGRRGRGRAWC